MTWTVTTPEPCPLPTPEQVSGASQEVVYTGTACLALMDIACVAQVWEDLLFDGDDHVHGDGGLMVNDAAIGVHLEHDGHFPVQVLRDTGGRVRALTVNLDPYAEDLDSLRRPVDWSDEDEHAHPDGRVHGVHDDGWSTPVQVSLRTATAVFGDPCGLPQADNTGGLVDLVFPAAGGWLHTSTWTQGGRRRLLAAVWSPR